MFEIKPFEFRYTEAVCQLILHIQQQEFQVPITLEDQPDLLQIPEVYQQNAGNFWVATAADAVVGTIGLIDCGGGLGCIRKMFVQKNWRGPERGIAQKLLDTLENWAVEKKEIKGLYLGTVERLVAAIRFYQKNGFDALEPKALPAAFPRMAVDTHFFWKRLALLT